jgi:hypothetical protein
MLVLAKDDSGAIVLWDLEHRMISAPFCPWCAGRLAFASLLGRLPTPEPEETFYPDGGKGLRALARGELAILLCALPPRLLDDFVAWFCDSSREDGHFSGPCGCDVSLHEKGQAK